MNVFLKFQIYGNRDDKGFMWCERVRARRGLSWEPPPMGAKVWGHKEFQCTVVEPIDRLFSEIELSIYQEEFVPDRDGTMQWDLDASGEIVDQLRDEIVHIISSLGIRREAICLGFSGWNFFIDLTKNGELSPSSEVSRLPGYIERDIVRSRWKELIKQVTIGMSRQEVIDLLGNECQEVKTRYFYTKLDSWAPGTCLRYYYGRYKVYLNYDDLVDKVG